MTRLQALQYLWHVLRGWAEEAEFWTSLFINVLLILGFIAWAFDPDAKLKDGGRLWTFVLGTFVRLVGVTLATLFNLILGLAMVSQPGLLGFAGWILFVVFLAVGIGLTANIIWRFKVRTT